MGFYLTDEAVHITVAIKVHAYNGGRVMQLIGSQTKYPLLYDRAMHVLLTEWVAEGHRFHVGRAGTKEVGGHGRPPSKK